MESLVQPLGVLHAVKVEVGSFTESSSLDLKHQNNKDMITLDLEILSSCAKEF